MAAPLTGIGQQQQPPISQPFQPGGTDQSREIRQREQEQRGDETQVQGASSARSQETTDISPRNFQENLNTNISTGSSEISSAQGRGSVIDITV